MVILFLPVIAVYADEHTNYQSLQKLLYFHQSLLNQAKDSVWPLDRTASACLIRAPRLFYTPWNDLVCRMNRTDERIDPRTQSRKVLEREEGILLIRGNVDD